MKAILCSLAVILALVAKADAKIVYCYWETWGGIPVEDIASSKICTHYAFAFMGIDGDTGRMKTIDDAGSYANAARFSQTIRRLHPGAKVMVSVGGWGEESFRYSIVADDEQKRRAFTDSAVEFCDKYGYDGIDLDWEYPTQRDSAHPWKDQANYVTWMKEIRAELDKTGRELTCAVGAPSGIASQAYNIRELAKAATFINLMTYDMHGSWESTTGHHSSMKDNTPNNVRDAVAYWRKQGAPPNKLVLGVPFYGRSFRLKNTNINGIGAPALGAGEGGGFISYKDICKDKNWNLRWDNTQQATYAFKGDQWVGFDNEQSMAVKAKFILDEGLAGGMVWAVDTDDVYGRCSSRKLPLLNALNAGLSGASPRPPVEVTTTQKPTVTQKPPTNTNPDPTTCSTDGYFRDPSDCSKFYACSGGVKFPSQQCPSDLMFDEVGNFCNYAELVQC